MNQKPKIVFHKIMLSFLVIAVVLSGCGLQTENIKSEETSVSDTQLVETKDVEKVYPFSLSESASIVEYPADNMYALTSIISDVDEDKNIWIFEFDKHTEREDAKQFALGVESRTGIHGCNSDVVNVGVSNRFFETDDFFYIYVFYKSTKEVEMISIDNDAFVYWIENGTDQTICLRTAEYDAVVDGQSGILQTFQEQDAVTKEWQEIEQEFRAVEIGIY